MTMPALIANLWSRVQFRRMTHRRDKTVVLGQSSRMDGTTLMLASLRFASPCLPRSCRSRFRTVRRVWRVNKTRSLRMREAEQIRVLGRVRRKDTSFQFWQSYQRPYSDLQDCGPELTQCLKSDSAPTVFERHFTEPVAISEGDLEKYSDELEARFSLLQMHVGRSR